MSLVEPTLVAMPEVVKDHLFQYLSYFDIARLHKTCHDLRDYINVSRPDSRYHMIKVVQAADNIQVNTMSEHRYDRTNSLVLKYRKRDGGFLVNASVYTTDDFRSCVDGVDYLEAFFRDFGMILQHQKSILFEMEISPFNSRKQRSQFWKAMQKVFEESGRIRSQSCILKHVTAPDVISILPFFDATCIEDIKLIGMKDGQVNPMDGIMELEHWKNLKAVILDDFSIGNMAQNIAHLNYFCCDTPALTVEDVIQIKNLFFHPTQISRCHFVFRDLNIKQNLYNFLGPAEERGENVHVEKKKWSFQSPIGGQELKVTIFPANEKLNIWFDRIIK
ncbi:hypothetical protein CRE_23431 [Caenorhabditis remanei]|uniref:F-box domain-containing protein n=1 Tax=Caenorhabditis remanei TaxID=31234 RepID=E3MGR1_CAERE|nr:hypothetical protein CRE_23431 [Caenorhabditis remanei]